MTTDANPHCRIGKVTWRVDWLDRVEAELVLHRIPQASEALPVAKSAYDNEPSQYDRNGYCDNPSRGY